MNDPLIFAFGCGVTFLCLAGIYVYIRSRLSSQEDTEPTGAVASDVAENRVPNTA